MPTFKTYKFQNMADKDYFLNGRVLGRTVPTDATGYSGIVGKTLKFKKPSIQTVTFVAGSSTTDPTMLTFREVAAQVTAALATVSVLHINGQLMICEKNPSSGVTIDKTGTANIILGFDGYADTVGSIYSFPDGFTAAVAPHWVQEYFANGYHVVVVRE